MRSGDSGNGFDDFEMETAAILDIASPSVISLIAIILQELVREVAVCTGRAVSSSSAARMHHCLTHEALPHRILPP